MSSWLGSVDPLYAHGVTFAVVPRQGWTAARVEREVKQVIYA